MFESDLVTSWYRVPKCTHCNLEYKLFKKSEGDCISRRPMILPCSHLICEKCIKTRSTIKCTVCKVVTNHNSKRHVFLQFDMQLYLFGYINQLASNMSFILKQNEMDVKFGKKIAHPATPGAQLLSALTAQKKLDCTECMAVQTDRICNQCNEAYCGPCFRKVHSSGRALKRHELVCVDRSAGGELGAEVLMCQRHREHELNYYCQQCGLAVCDECKAGYHSRHTVTSLLLENRKSVPKLRELAENLQCAKDLIEKGKQDTSDEAINQIKHRAQVAVEEIFQHFLEQHTMLQQAEKKAMLELKSRANHAIVQLKNTRTLLNDSHNKIEEAMARINHFCSEIPKHSNVPRMVEEVNSMLENTPCSVDLQSIGNIFGFHKTTCTAPLIFLDEPIKIHLLSFYGLPCDVKAGKPSEPMRKNRLPASKPTGPPSFTYTVQPHRSSNHSMMSNNQSMNDTQFSIRLSDKLSYRSNTSTLKHHLKEHTLDEQLVQVSHINHPQQFYVQNMDFMNVAHTFTETCKAQSEYAARPTCILLNEMYLVLQLKLWYRAKMIRQIDESLFEMWFVDYGRTEEIDSDRIRCISKDLATRPYGARECSIYAIKPADGKAWTADVNQLMSEIISNEPVSMITLTEREDGVRLVDLIIGHRKHTASMRDALTTLGYAAADTTTGSALVKTIKAIHAKKQERLQKEQMCFKRHLIKVSEMVDVTVVNVVSPMQFYVMKDLSLKTYAEMMDQFQTIYKTTPHNPIYVPQPEMVCAVLNQNTWHRARINGRCESKPNEFEVLLVDLATSLTIDWRHIRELDDQFLNLPEAVTYCSLAHIKPLPSHSEIWSADAIAVFRRATQHSRIHAEFAAVTNSRYSVILYQMNKDKMPININELLVKRGFALDDGLTTTSLKDHQIYANANEPDAHEQTPMNRSMRSQTPDRRTKVKLVHVESPGEFYVTLKKHLSGIQQMNMLIQEHMHEVRALTPQTKWRSGDLCLVLAVNAKDKENRSWYRGRILTIDHESDECLVFMRDQGIKEVVSHEELAPIPEKFKTVADGATLCHLACVQPTNELTKWSSVAIDRFKSVANEFEGLGVSLQGVRKNNSISVILWGLTSDSSDPLQNTVYRWLNINKILVQKGLAHMSAAFNPLGPDDSEQKKLDEMMQANGEDQFDVWLDRLIKSVKPKKKQPKPTLEDMVYDLHSKTTKPTSEINLTGSWKPAELIDKNIFTGLVTYVDNNGILYLHDFSQEEVMDQIRKVVNDRSKFTVPYQPGVNTSWRANDSCLAKFHLDGQFHRAVLLSIDKTLGVAAVQFVDYGNVENCPMYDLLPPGTLLSNIPIQARKYCLANLRPIATSEEHWPRDTLDFLHGQVVGKVSTVTRVTCDENDVGASGITLCRIVSNGVPIHELLVDMNMAYYDTQHMLDERLDIRKDDTIHVRVNNAMEEPTNGSANTAMDEAVPQALPSKPASKVKRKKLRKTKKLDDAGHFEPGFMDYDKYAKHFAAMSEREAVDAPHSNDEDAEVEYCANRMYDFLTVDECQSDTDLSESGHDSSDTKSTIFEPADTSTQFSTSTKVLHWSRQYPFTNFRTIDLDVGLTFIAQAMMLPDALHIWIHPEGSLFQSVWNNMTKEIEHGCHSRQRIAIDKIYPGLVCLAVFNDDGKLYRALVKHYDGVLDEVQIVFIDYMNEEIVSAHDIYVCPKELVATPLMNVLVQLHGVRVNPRLREFDVKQRLAQVLQDVHFQVRVVRKTALMAEVELFELTDLSKMESRLVDPMLVYQDLINEKFFISTKK